MRGKFLDLYLGIFISNISLLTDFSSQVGNGFALSSLVSRKFRISRLENVWRYSPLGPGLPQRAPPFFSIPSSSPSILAFIGSVTHPSGRQASIFLLVFPTDLVSWDSPLRNFSGNLSSNVLMT